MTLRSELLRRRSLLSAGNARKISTMPSRRIIPQSSIYRPSATVRSRSTATIRSRPTGIIPPRPIALVPSRPTIGGIIPIVKAQPLATSGGGGLATPSITGGLGLDEIGGDIKAFGGDILNQIKALIPTVIKIFAAIIIFKIVLWLLRGRRR